MTEYVRKFREDMIQPLTSEQLEHFREQGFLILKSAAVSAFQADMEETIRQISLRLLRKIGVDIGPLEGMSYDALVKWCYDNEKDSEYTRLFYEMYPTMAEVIATIAHPLPTWLAKSVGITSPIPITLPAVRVDRPGNTRYMTNPHQDYWYSLLCDNSVVIWFPLVSIDRDMGLLGVVPGSHKDGFQPFSEAPDGCTFTMRNDYPESSYVEASIGKDEILIFKIGRAHV